MSNRLYALPSLRRKTLHDLASNSQTRRIARLCVSVGSGLMLLLVVWLLSACQTLPAVPCEAPKPITPPALSQVLPSQTYLKQSQQSDETSARKLTGMSPTFGP
jgi:hypothetical protein